VLASVPSLTKLSNSADVLFLLIEAVMIFVIPLERCVFARAKKAAPTATNGLFSLKACDLPASSRQYSPGQSAASARVPLI